jgi:hypothetical protein
VTLITGGPMTRDRRRASSFCAVLALAFPLGAMAQAIRLGAEFQVNIQTASHQRFPSVAREADGDFVVVWESYAQDGHLEGIFGARFSSAGARLATEFQVNSYTPSRQKVPQVAADADGDFVVVWHSDGSYGVTGQDGSAGGIFARRFSSTGVALASEFQVNTFTGDNQHYPSVALDADGDFVVAWHSTGDGSGYGIFAQRFSSTGVAQAIEFQVNTYTPFSQGYPSIAAYADGDFVVAWQDRYQDGNDVGVFARRFSSAGIPATTEFQANTYTTNQQSNAWVAVAPSGDFVITWDSVYQDASGHGVFAQRFSSAGTGVGIEFQVTTATVGNQGNPAVGVDADGDFAVTWSISSSSVQARRFSSAGTPLRAEFQVNIYDTGQQSYPSLGMDADGDFVIAWQDGGRDGSGYGVFAQRFAASILLDIDGNGVAQPLTDGLLALRFLFGFTGATLTSGAVGGGCSRCDAAAIEPYLQGLV